MFKKKPSSMSSNPSYVPKAGIVGQKDPESTTSTGDFFKSLIEKNGKKK